SRWSLSGFSTFRDVCRTPCRAWSVFVAAAVLLAASPATALDRVRGLSQYIRDEWGPSKGYSGGPVYGFAQGADGYLWIASDRGLLRFDGLRFETVDLPLPTTSGGAAVVGVAATDEGAIWARLRASS